MAKSQLTRREFARILAGGAFAFATVRGNTSRAQPQRGEDSFAFGVLADAQYCDAEPSGTRYYRASSKKLAACVDAFNQLELAFAIHLGDFIDRDFQSYDVMVPIYNRVKAPHYHVLGNHDFSVAEERLDGVVQRLGLPNRYYCFRTGGWRLIVLDGNDLSLIARRKGSPEYERAQSVYTNLKAQNAPNAQTWNGGIGEGQLAWLEGQLGTADKAGENVIVFCHFPVFPENVHNLWNATEVIETLESHRSVVAYMNGHNHAGNYGQKNGIHYLTFPGMVETPNTTAYAVVEVRPNGLKVKGYGRTRSRLLDDRQ
jgi:predicted phosphodiesterase